MPGASVAKSEEEVGTWHHLVGHLLLAALSELDTCQLLLQFSSINDRCEYSYGFVNKRLAFSYERAGQPKSLCSVTFNFLITSVV